MFSYTQEWNSWVRVPVYLFEELPVFRGCTILHFPLVAHDFELLSSSPKLGLFGLFILATLIGVKVGIYPVD